MVNKKIDLTHEQIQDLQELVFDIALKMMRNSMNYAYEEGNEQNELEIERMVKFIENL